MSLKLYAHPFSSYCQKVLVALYENDTPFEYRMLAAGQPQVTRELAALWPMKRLPLLVDAGRTVVEASIIIEHLGLHHPGPVRAAARRIRAPRSRCACMDRFFDNYISTPQQKIVSDSLRPEAERDAHGVADARAMLDTAYAWLDQADGRPRMGRRANASAWPTARPRRSCSMPTGRIGSTRRSRM